MTGTESQQNETAQNAYTAMLCTRIAPGLRALGFNGSGSAFSMARGDYQVGLNFQRNKRSTRDSVTFDVNLSVGHQANNESFARENAAARQLGKEFENPTSGAFFARLSKLGEQKEDFPWTVTPGGPNDAVARDVLETIRVYFLPRVEEELRRPLEAPTPATERADRSPQHERNEGDWAWHEEVLERAGVRNLRRIDRNPGTD